MLGTANQTRGVLCWDEAVVLSVSLSRDVGLVEPSLLGRSCAPRGCPGCRTVLEAGSPSPVNKLWLAVTYKRHRPRPALCSASLSRGGQQGLMLSVRPVCVDLRLRSRSSDLSEGRMLSFPCDQRRCSQWAPGLCVNSLSASCCSEDPRWAAVCSAFRGRRSPMGSSSLPCRGRFLRSHQHRQLSVAAPCATWGGKRAPAVGLCTLFNCSLIKRVTPGWLRAAAVAMGRLPR